MMMNQYLKEFDYPEEWKRMNIKSVSKNGKKKMEMEYRRGLFLTNILSKCMEKILLNRRRTEIEENMTQFQSGE